MSRIAITDRVPGGRVTLAMVALLLLALALRVVVVTTTLDYRPISDSLDYHRHALSIAEGHGYPPTPFGIDGGATAFRPPLYPYFLGGVYASTGARLTPARLAGALLGTLTVLLIYLVAARIWGRRTGLVACGLAAVFPPLVMMNAALQSESLFLPLELGAVLAVLAYRDDRRLRWAVAAGVLCGLAALTRSNGSLFVLAAALGVWVLEPRFKLRSLMPPLVVAVAAALTIAPWTIRNAVTFDAFVPLTTQTGFALAGTYNDASRGFDDYPATWRLPITTTEYGPLYSRRDLNEAELDSRLRSKALDYAVHHRGYVLESIWFNTLRMFDLAPAQPLVYDIDRRQQNLSRPANDLVRWSTFVAIALALLGAVALLLRPRGRRGPGFVWLFPVLAMVGAVAILGLTRYRQPVYPFLVMLAAIALVDGWVRLSRRLGAPTEAV